MVRKPEVKKVAATKDLSVPVAKARGLKGGDEGDVIPTRRVIAKRK